MDIDTSKINLESFAKDVKKLDLESQDNKA